ncbi:hypothetical protein VPNG_07457 [Cytospora leucostoma]|uniref:protein-tyrosine-phosphatase n=1 Tax=Cytospora leucostoma TaxID=1230097 RepID=A0A423WME8_9PEZI|nr:hypothetical protein VPNG_07457 [Cytospora leucostoma]
MSTTAAGRFYDEQIQSYMAVYDLDQAMQDQDTVTVHVNSHIRVGRLFSDNHGLVYRFVVLLRSLPFFVTRFSCQPGTSQCFPIDNLWGLALYGHIDRIGTFASSETSDDITRAPTAEKHEGPSKPPSCHDADDAIMEEDSPIRSQMANRAFFDTEPYHEKETNEDQKSVGYPDGPIAIYGDNVYLYLEPTADEASNFDVVINVAREVANPFEAKSGQDDYMQDIPVPDTAMTNSSFATAFEYMPEDMTPTTPKAAMSPNRPEYIHIPWDHNTDISQDLMHLCETIERKTMAGKKVLVHCQQGASRSASLIIAYGLYQNPALSVNDAYYAAQSKSKWISPNMRLMYCLQDFQKEVSKKRSPNPVYKPRSGRSPSKHRMTLSVDAIDVPKEPRTAPLPEEEGLSRHQPPEKSPLRARGHSTPEQISPGPSSAPSSLSWAQKDDESDMGRFGRFNYTERFTAPTPIEQKASFGFPSSSNFSQPFSNPPPSPGFGPSLADSFSQPPPSPGFGSHRFGAMSKKPAHNSFRGLTGMRFVEVPPTPTDRFFSLREAPEERLFSPREPSFPRDTFNPFGRPRQVPDPRSPPTKGEAPIIRSIDEML